MYNDRILESGNHMSYINNIKSILTSFALLMQIAIVEANASFLGELPGDVFRTFVCKHLHIYDIVNISQTSWTMRRVILSSDNGKTAIKSSLGKQIFNMHNGEFDEETLAQKDFVHYRSDGELPAIIPAAGSKDYLWGILVGFYKSVPAEHYAKFANCTRVGFAGLDKLTNDDLKHFSNAVSIDLNGCRGITDEGIAHLKNARILYLRGLKVTYKGLGQLVHLKVVERFDNGLLDVRELDEERINSRELLKKRGVKVYL